MIDSIVYFHTSRARVRDFTALTPHRLPTAACATAAFLTATVRVGRF
jgi:hypothetical protein